MASKKTPAKTATEKSPAKPATPKPAAKKAAAKKDAPSAAKKPTPSVAKKATPGAKKSGKAASDNYTNPALREKLKQQVIAGDKGGRAGQWSARKAQLLAHEYEAEGGGYKHPRDAAQKSLKAWGDEHWHTADGKQAVEGDETHRYLPDAAWKELSPEQRKATDEKKVAGSKAGRQFVPNTPAASKARKHAVKAEG